MKKLFFAVLFISALAYMPARAQFSIKLNLNLGSQPDWGPTGYDHAEYYYMPDIDTYYDVPNRQYVYLNNGSWTRANALPPRYANYDLYHGYKVVVNQPTPYLHADVYRAKYARFKGQRNQVVIRDSHEDKYRNSRAEWNNHKNDRRDEHRGDHDHDNDRHDGNHNQ